MSMTLSSFGYRAIGILFHIFTLNYFPYGDQDDKLYASLKVHKFHVNHEKRMKMKSNLKGVVHKEIRWCTVSNKTCKLVLFHP